MDEHLKYEGSDPRQLGLVRIGEAAREVLDARDTSTALDVARRRFVEGRPAAPRIGLRRVAVFAVAAALAASALVVSWPRAAPVSFDVGTKPGAAGQWVAADAAPVDVRFSEGTTLRLAPGARMRITELSAEGASVLVERGRVDATVHHRDAHTAWLLRAGPFQVRVTGTQFDATWTAETETLEITMREGAIVVSGPPLATDRTVVAGERLVVSAASGAMEHRTIADGPHAALAAPTAAPAVVEAAASAPSAEATAVAGASPIAAGAEPSAAPSAEAASAVAASPAWRSLAAAGKYREAFAAAQAAGLDGEMGRASSSDLIALADSARFAGRADVAREALLVARHKGARGRTAFLIGKIAADQQGRGGDAVTWFETYLREEPHGPLAEQALGRLLELERGNPAAARALAARYLSSYPRGSQASLARSLEGSAAGPP